MILDELSASESSRELETYYRTLTLIITNRITNRLRQTKPFIKFQRGGNKLQDFVTDNYKLNYRLNKFLRKFQRVEK